MARGRMARARSGPANPPRSLLFVPGDRPDRFAKALASGADAVIFDLEDGVAPSAKVDARRAIMEVMTKAAPTIDRWVRINALDDEEVAADITLVRSVPIDAILLPKAAGSDCVRRLGERLARDVPIIPIALERGGDFFGLGGFREVAGRLGGLTWGGEDLAADLGAERPLPGGGGGGVFAMARAALRMAAAAAQVPAFETVFPHIEDDAGLRLKAEAAFRDGFSGMLAIHPRQIAIINAAFTPSPEAIAAAGRIIEAFANHPGAGALRVDGGMVDAPHLRKARRIMALAGRADARDTAD